MDLVNRNGNNVKSHKVVIFNTMKIILRPSYIFFFFAGTNVGCLLSIIVFHIIVFISFPKTSRESRGRRCRAGPFMLTLLCLSSLPVL